MSAGPGFNDAEGVYKFGEADSTALWSDLMNLGQDSVSAAFVVDRARLTAVESAQAGLRLKHLAISTGTVASGTNLGTISIPRRSVAQRVVIDMAGVIAPVGAAGNVGVTLAASAGGTVVANATYTVTVANGYLGQYARKAIFDIAAGAGADVVITHTLSVATTATSGQVSVLSTAQIFPAGQY